VTETELRELLKLIRGVEHYIERCLRTEQEKNEDRVKQQLENSGVTVTDGTVESPMEEFEL
jgi:hypothetical protein